MPTSSAFDAFNDDPSPLNAVTLAIADHKDAGNGVDDRFVDALHRAGAQLAAHDELVAVCRSLVDADKWRSLNPDSSLVALHNFAEAASDARAVLAKLPPRSP